jgi:hypothetical protein
MSSNAGNTGRPTRIHNVSRSGSQNSSPNTSPNVSGHNSRNGSDVALVVNLHDVRSNPGADEGGNASPRPVTAAAGIAMGEHKNEGLRDHPHERQNGQRELIGEDREPRATCCFRFHEATAGLRSGATRMARAITRIPATGRAWREAPGVMLSTMARDLVVTTGTSFGFLYGMRVLRESLPELEHPWNGLAATGALVVVGTPVAWAGGTALWRASNGSVGRSSCICANLVNTLVIPVAASILTAPGAPTAQAYARNVVNYLVGATLPRMGAQGSRDGSNFLVSGAISSIEPQLNGASLVTDSPIYRVFHGSRLTSGTIGYAFIIALHQLFLRDQITECLIAGGMDPTLAAMLAAALSAGTAEGLDAMNGIIAQYHAAPATGVDLVVKPRKGRQAYKDGFSYVRYHGAVRTLFFPSIDALVAASRLYERGSAAWLACRVAAALPHIASEARGHLATLGLGSLNAEKDRDERLRNVEQVVEELSPYLEAMQRNRIDVDNIIRSLQEQLPMPAESGGNPPALPVCHRATIRAVLLAMGQVAAGERAAQDIVHTILRSFDVLLHAQAAYPFFNQSNITRDIHDRAILTVLHAVLGAWNENSHRDSASIEYAILNAARVAAENGIYIRRESAYDPSQNLDSTEVHIVRPDAAIEHYVLGAGIVPLPPLSTLSNPQRVLTIPRPTRDGEEEMKVPRSADDAIVLRVWPRSPSRRGRDLLHLRADSSSSSSSSSSSGFRGESFSQFASDEASLRRAPGDPPRPLDEYISNDSSSESDDDVPLPPPTELPPHLLGAAAQARASSASTPAGRPRNPLSAKSPKIPPPPRPNKR